MSKSKKNNSQTNARIGNIAEKVFLPLCAWCGITATKPDEDLYGFDFNLEFKREIPINVFIDQQETYCNCNVQVKGFEGEYSDYQGRDIKLSNIKTMIDNDRPQFFAFIAIDSPNGEIYMVHLDAQLIEEGLKRIRELEAEYSSEVELNKYTIRINPHTRNATPVTRYNFMSYLTEIIGESMANYSAKKVETRRSVGYEDSKFVINANLTLDDLINVTLGLEKQVPMDVIGLLDNRFNIPLPDYQKLSEFAGAELISSDVVRAQIRAIHNDSHSYEVRLIKGPEEITMTGQLRHAMQFNSDKLVMETPFFFLIVDDKEAKCRLKYDEILKKPQTYSFLSKMFDCYFMLLGGEKYTLKIHHDTGVIAFEFLPHDHQFIEQCRSDNSLFRDYMWLRDKLRIDVDEKVNLQECISNRDYYNYYFRLFKDEIKGAIKLGAKQLVVPEGDKLTIISPIEVHIHDGAYLLISIMTGTYKRKGEQLFLIDHTSKLNPFTKIRSNTFEELIIELEDLMKQNAQSIVSYQFLTPSSKEKCNEVQKKRLSAQED